MERRPEEPAEGSLIRFFPVSTLAEETLLYRLQAGSYHCPSGYRVERPSFRGHLLMAVLEGEGYAGLAGAEKPVSPGSLVLIDTRKPHVYGTQTGWETLWVHFSGGGSDGLVSAVLALRGTVSPLQNGRLEDMETLFREESTEAACAVCLYRLLTGLLCPEKEGRRGPIQEAARFMRENFSRPLSVKEIAESVYLSPYHFSRRFRAEMGDAPYTYLLRLRISEAKRLLQTTSLSVGEVAEACGFTDDGHFSVVFRQYAGSSPGEFRRLAF